MMTIHWNRKLFLVPEFQKKKENVFSIYPLTVSGIAHFYVLDDKAQILASKSFKEFAVEKKEIFLDGEVQNSYEILR